MPLLRPRVHICRLVNITPSKSCVCDYPSVLCTECKKGETVGVALADAMPPDNTLPHAMVTAYPIIEIPLSAKFYRHSVSASILRAIDHKKCPLQALH